MFMYVFNIAGSVESRQCAVQIGFGHGYNNFRGRLSLVGINCTLKSFKIYIFLQNVLDNLILIVFKINNVRILFMRFEITIAKYCIIHKCIKLTHRISLFIKGI